MNIEKQITTAMRINNYDAAPFIERALLEQLQGKEHYRLTGQVTRTGKPVFIKLQ